MNTLTGSERFRADIEGLRAIAVFGVVAFHFGLTGLPGGFTGVDIFFVISGYLITQHLQREINKSGSVDLWRFYARRARRLLPASFFVIMMTLLAGYFILSPSEQGFYSKGSLFASAYMINLWLIRWSVDYFATDATANPFIHFWSLSVEEQFYLVWPALLLLLARFRTGEKSLFILLSVIAVLSFGFCWWVTDVSPPWAFYLSPLRAWEFACGGLASLAIAEKSTRRLSLSPAMGWLGLAIIISAYLVIDEDIPFPAPTAALPVAGAVMLLLSGNHPSAKGPIALLSRQPFQWIGKISYSLYLWHWPIIVYAAILKPELTVADRLACGAVAIVLSVMTYHLIENPMRRNLWLTARTSRSLGFAALITATGAGVGYASASLARHNMNPQQTSILNSAELASTARQSDTKCVLERDIVQPAPCSFGAANPKKTIVLFGDSHADHWSTPLIRIAKQNGWRLVTYLKSSCPAASVSTWNQVLLRNYDECDQWRSLAIRQITALKPDAIVISEYASSYVRNTINFTSSHQIEVKDWAEGVKRTVDVFNAAGSKVVVLRDGPIHRSYLDKCVARALWQKRGSEICDTPRDEALEETIPTAERFVVSQAPNAEYVDLTNLFCNAATCPAMISGRLTFRDRHHIATPYAGSLAAPLQHAVFDSPQMAAFRN